MPRAEAGLFALATLLVGAGASVGAFLAGIDDAVPVLVVGSLSMILVALARPTRNPDRDSAIDERMDRLDERIVTAREERYRLRVRAETAGRFREDFVGAVRHELNTPLNAILGFSDVLLQDVDGPLTPQQREDVEHIRAAGSYLGELVDAVLSEWHPDRFTPLPEVPIDATELFTRACRLLEGQRRHRDVALSFKISPSFVAPRADSRRVLQILINLGTNALRATERGTVSFEAKNAPGEARLIVRDTGSGIASSELEKIFDPFYRAAELEGSGGSGLGLAIALELALWHGGHISVESVLGEGSAFTLHLPLVER
ncbi:MAG: sensor histidine kinase [Sandaracinaceae bacterium]